MIISVQQCDFHGARARADAQRGAQPAPRKAVRSQRPEPRTATARAQRHVLATVLTAGGACWPIVARARAAEQRIPPARASAIPKRHCRRVLGAAGAGYPQVQTSASGRRSPRSRKRRGGGGANRVAACALAQNETSTCSRVSLVPQPSVQRCQPAVRGATKDAGRVCAVFEAVDQRRTRGGAWQSFDAERQAKLNAPLSAYARSVAARCLPRRK